MTVFQDENNAVFVVFLQRLIKTTHESEHQFYQ